MLPNKIKITAEDIEYAEKILLPKGMSFDSERREFIANLDTIDLQAVPGSGKTTALLAKLLILEKYMPFNDGSGVLVISHTNIAVDEIKNKIGTYCPRLFAYPNFIGTIQSFVDQFMANPYYVNQYKKKTYRIDSEIYDEKIIKYYGQCKEYKLKGWLNNNGGIEFLKKVRFDQALNLIPGINKDSTDFKLKDKNSGSYKAIKKIKESLMKWGYLHFDDAYFLANLHIEKFPQIATLLQKRFRFVFVDEMQDMDKHQHDILEKLFFAENTLEHCYQRIGDLNQAIHHHPASEDCWMPRDTTKNLLGSHRLTCETAEVVKWFGLCFQEIKGLRKSCGIKPCIIVFSDPKEVLPRFAELIKEKELSDKDHPFCAIGWVGKEASDHEKLIIKSYHETFEKNHQNPKIDYTCLKDYLKFYDKKDHSLRSIRENILNIFVKILRIENKKDENERNYNVKRFINFLHENNEEKYNEFKLKLFKWAFATKKGEEMYEDLKEYIRSFFNEIFSIRTFSPETNDFINSMVSSGTEYTNPEIEIDKSNYFEKDDIKVRIGTVHSVKGETHTATLYMESSYNSKYESQRLYDQLKCKKLEKAKPRIKESAKMAYVGFSRPTHLLCFAIHKDRIKDFTNDNWEVINAINPINPSPHEYQKIIK